MVSQQPLDGCCIEGYRLARAIAVADKRAQKNGISVLLIENCVIANLSVRDTTIRTPLHFVRCKFVGPVSLEKVAMNELHVEECVGNRRIELMDCGVERNPKITSNRFHEGLTLDLQLQPEDRCKSLEELSFENCEFLGESDFTFKALKRIHFLGCRFGAGSQCEIVAPGCLLALFLRCSVAGRVKLDNLPFLNTMSPGAVIDLERSLISGHVDLSDFNLNHIGMYLVSVNGGAVEISYKQLAEQWNLFKSFDFCGRLRSESQFAEFRRSRTAAIFDEVADDPSFEWYHESPVERLQNVSREYEQLHYSCVTLPGMDLEEDYCHYKYLDFANRVRIEQVGPATYQFGLLAIFATFVMFLCLFSLDKTDWHQFFALAVPIPYVVYLVRSKSDVKMAVSCIWHSALKWTLGFGVRLRRVLFSGLVVVAGFAALYFFISRSHEDIGCVLQKEQNVLKGTDQEPVHWRLAARRSLYFSAVTFTTLGYGDFQPKGRLQLLCAAEAFLGAAMVAMATVVLARRYLRM